MIAGTTITLSRSPVDDAVRGLVDVSDGLADAFFAAAQRTLRRLLTHAELPNAFPVTPTDRLFRHLLFADPLKRFGIWALTWPSGVQTPIHNHHCSCAFAVYRGRIEEVIYAVAPDGGEAIETARFVRDAGYVGGAPLEHGIIHEMLNRGTTAAVSLHVYAYRPDHREDSIDRCFTCRPHS